MSRIQKFSQIDKLLLLLLLLNLIIFLRIIIVEPGGPRRMAKAVCFCVYGNMMSSVLKENDVATVVSFVVVTSFFDSRTRIFIKSRI